MTLEASVKGQGICLAEGRDRKRGTSRGVTVGLDTGHHFHRARIGFRGPGRSPKSFKEHIPLGQFTTMALKMVWKRRGRAQGGESRPGLGASGQDREGSHGETLKRG